MNRLLAVDKPPTCAGEWLMPPGSPYRLRLIDRAYRWAAWRHYPRSNGDVTLIGPDCFADQDATVVCWQGENYYRPGHEPSEVDK